MVKKLIIIGIDSGDLNLIEKYLPQLPNFQKVFKNGVSGKLKTTVPPLTPCAWSSFMCGKNPGQHGIYDFAYLGEDKKLKLFDSTQRVDKDIWQILSDFGYRSIVFNVPMTYPAYPINGLMITDFTTPTLAGALTHPASLKQELLARFPNYKIAEESKFSQNIKDQREFLGEIYELLDLQAEVFSWLLDNHQWDLAMVVFNVNDHLNHWYRQFASDEQSEFREALLKGYKKTDAKIGQLLEKHQGANFIFMSDHGTGRYYQDVNLNHWLLKNKYIYFKKGQGGFFKDLLEKLGISASDLTKIALNLGLWKIINKLEIKQSLVKHTSRTFEDIDWAKTKAYSFGYYGPIYVTAKEGREKIVAGLKEKFLKLKGLDGQKLISDIWTKDELYHGRYIDRMPDLIFAMQDFTYGCSSSFAFGGNKLFTNPKTFKNGDHSLYGMIAALGPDFKNTGERIAGANIIDIAPTVLRMFDIKIPDDFDGKTLGQFLNKPESGTPIR